MAEAYREVRYPKPRSSHMRKAIAISR